MAQIVKFGNKWLVQNNHGLTLAVCSNKKTASSIFGSINNGAGFGDSWPLSMFSVPVSVMGCDYD